MPATGATARNAFAPKAENPGFQQRADGDDLAGGTGAGDLGGGAGQVIPDAGIDGDAGTFR